MKGATHTLNAKQKMCYNVLIIAQRLQDILYNVNSLSKHRCKWHTFEMWGTSEFELVSKRSTSFLCCQIFPLLESLRKSVSLERLN